MQRLALRAECEIVDIHLRKIYFLYKCTTYLIDRSMFSSSKIVASASAPLSPMLLLKRLYYLLNVFFVSVN